MEDEETGDVVFYDNLARSNVSDYLFDKLRSGALRATMVDILNFKVVNPLKCIVTGTNAEEPEEKLEVDDEDAITDATSFQFRHDTISESSERLLRTGSSRELLKWIK